MPFIRSISGGGCGGIPLCIGGVGGSCGHPKLASVPITHFFLHIEIEYIFFYVQYFIYLRTFCESR